MSGEASAYWVRRVFEDMCVAVKSRSAAPDQWEIGFVDQLVAPDERPSAVARALRSAEVFVPLYSLRYLRAPGPMNERATFQSRITGKSGHHILPVLWEPPLASKTMTEFDEAVAVAPGVPEYAENGLLALRRTSSYRNAYAELLGILSARIVQAAELWPLGVTPAVEVAPPQLEPAEAAFVVAVLAPTVDDLPRGRRRDVYGGRPSDWRPFGSEQHYPVAEQAARGPASHQFATQVVDFSPTMLPFLDCPGFLLVDPWILDTPNGRERLRVALESLPMWAMPLVVTDERDPDYGDRGSRLCEEATAMCATGRQRLRWRRDIRDVDAFDDFVADWVVVAIRHYDRHFRPRAAAGPYQGRPRLAGRSRYQGENNADV